MEENVFNENDFFEKICCLFDLDGDQSCKIEAIKKLILKELCNTFCRSSDNDYLYKKVAEAFLFAL